MSLFIGLLAFRDAALQDEVKVGVLVGSLVSAILGATLLSLAKRRLPAVPEDA
jgi:NhaA family Na+:H+ antiporter